MENIIYLIVGIAIGWITKIPFLLKWYSEFKAHKQHMTDLHTKLFEQKQSDQSNIKEKFIQLAEHWERLIGGLQHNEPKVNAVKNCISELKTHINVYFK